MLAQDLRAFSPSLVVKGAEKNGNIREEASNLALLHCMDQAEFLTKDFASWVAGGSFYCNGVDRTLTGNGSGNLVCDSLESI